MTRLYEALNIKQAGTEMMNNGERRELIEYLTLSGFQVLEYELPYGEWGYMLVHKFEPNYLDSSGAYNYHTAVGIDLTAFLRKNAMTNVNMFSNALQGYIQSNNNVVRLQLHKDVRWYKWIVEN